MEIVYISIILSALAGLVGMYLILQVFQGNEPPLILSIAHLGLATIALGLLVYHTSTGKADLLDMVLLFVVGSLGALAVFLKRDAEDKKLPKAKAAVHAAIAVSGIAFLIIYAAIK